MPNALQITDPNADNPLAQAPSWADAYGSVTGTVSSGVDALGQWLAAQRAKSPRPPMWSMSNPVGTETTRQPQQLTMPTPGVQPVAFWGGQPVSQQFKDMGQSAIGNALGWVGSAGPGGPIRAYHGSPYDFERFDTSKIGTGEGAQAYGHGLYFAEGEGVARSYKEGLSPRTLPDLSGYDVDPSTAERVANGWFDYLKNAAPADHAAMADYLRKQGAPVDQLGADILEGKLKANAGKMYEVNIGADPEQFLHWDKPLSQQTPQVQQAVANLNLPRDPGITPNDTGSAILQKVHAANYTPTGAPAGTPRRPEEVLQDAGIPGIRYLDQGSRGAGEGTHNYVVFDANTIDILRKYGLAGLGLGLGAAATNGSQQTPMAQ